MGAKRVSPAVLQYLTDRIGQVVYRADVARDLKLNEEQVKSAVYNIRQRDKDMAASIQVIQIGVAWRYRPNFESKPAESPTKPAKKTVRMFEEVADLGDDGIILRCEDGKIYQAKQLHT